MHCPQCGSKIYPDARFCHECGFDVQAIIKKDTVGVQPVDCATPAAQLPDDKIPAQQTFAPTSRQVAHQNKVRARNYMLMLVVCAALVIFAATQIYRVLTQRDCPQLNLYTSYQTSEFAQTVARSEFKTHNIAQLGGVNLTVYTSPSDDQARPFIDTVKGYFSFTTVLKGHLGKTASWKDIFTHAQLGKPMVVTVNIPQNLRSVLGIESDDQSQDVPLAVYVERVDSADISKKLSRLISKQDLLDKTRFEDHLQKGDHPAGAELYKGVDGAGNYWIACIKEDKAAYNIFLSVSPDVAVVNWTQESLLGT